MNGRPLGAALASLLMLLALFLNGCGGTKVLKDPQPITLFAPLTSTSNQLLNLSLDWVIVRDGPGTWAKNADWDEYLLRVENLGSERVRISAATLVDSMGVVALPGNDRKKLVSASKKTAKRYKQHDLTVQSGVGGAQLVAMGVVTGAASSGAALAAAYGSTSAGVAGAAAVGLLAAPLLIVGGVVRGVNSRQVNKEIGRRSTFLPVDLQPESEQELRLFFPVTPSPRSLHLSYSVLTGWHELILDTNETLLGLHLPEPESTDSSGPTQNETN